jgi:hypothetical protein
MLGWRCCDLSVIVCSIIYGVRRECVCEFVYVRACVGLIHMYVKLILYVHIYVYM